MKKIAKEKNQIEKANEIKVVTREINFETHDIVSRHEVTELRKFRIDKFWSSLTDVGGYDATKPYDKKIFDLLMLLLDKFSLAKRYSTLHGIRFDEEIVKGIDAYLEFEQMLSAFRGFDSKENPEYFADGTHVESVVRGWEMATMFGLPNGPELYATIYDHKKGKIREEWGVYDYELEEEYSD